MEILDIISFIAAIIFIICFLVCGVYGFIFLIKVARVEHAKKMDEYSLKKDVMVQLLDTLESVEFLAEKRVEIINLYNDIDSNK